MAPGRVCARVHPRGLNLTNGNGPLLRQVSLTGSTALFFHIIIHLFIIQMLTFSLCSTLATHEM